MDKFALVYEFNNNSPLITYKAVKEHEAKNYSKALELFPKALEKYPYYATTYFVYALALANNNEFDKAKEMVEKGHNLLGVNSTFEFYMEAIDKIKREANGISVNFDDTVNEVLNESFLEPEEFDSSVELDLLNDKLSIDEPIQNSNFEENSIVTETLAEIYASQNNFEEALEIYKKLKELKPDLTEKFDIKIAELNIAIDNKKNKRFGN